MFDAYAKDFARETTANFETDTCRRAAPRFSFKASVQTATRRERHTFTHLEALESESIHILREVAPECRNPAQLFSGGKDSIVLLRLAKKAFRPACFPFPLLHTDTCFQCK